MQKTNINVVVTMDMKSKLVERAKQDKVSQSDVMRSALNEYLKDNNTTTAYISKDVNLENKQGVKEWIKQKLNH